MPSDESRALAHPLRARLVAHLRREGPTSGAALARALDTHTGATSYHLRVLEAAGLVVDAGLGDGRTRVWQAAAESRRGARHAGGDPDEVAAERWLEHDYIDHFADRAHRLVDHLDDWPEPWRTELGLRDAPLLLSAQQLVAFRAELDALLARYRRIGQGTPGARRVVAHAALSPLDGPPQHAPPTPAPGTARHPSARAHPIE